MLYVNGCNWIFKCGAIKRKKLIKKEKADLNIAHSHVFQKMFIEIPLWLKNDTLAFKIVDSLNVACVSNSIKGFEMSTLNTSGFGRFSCLVFISLRNTPFRYCSDTRESGRASVKKSSLCQEMLAFQTWFLGHLTAQWNNGSKSVSKQRHLAHFNHQ